MKTRLLRFTLLVVLTALANATAATPARADTWTVTSTDDSYGPGTLRSAIGFANQDDSGNVRIVFDLDPTIEGLQFIAFDHALPELEISNDMTIQGPGQDKLVVDGWQARVFHVAPSARVTISGFRIGGGSGLGQGWPPGAQLLDGYGGSILNEGDLTLTDCVVVNGIIFADWFGVKGGFGWGGGIANLGTMSVDQCEVKGCAADSGWGGAIYNEGTMTITNSDILGGPGTNWVVGNEAGNGGGIYNAGSMTLDNCYLTGNQAGVGDKNGIGGGIYNAKDADLIVLNSTVTGNSAPKWPDLYNAGNLYVENSDIGDSKK